MYKYKYKYVITIELILKPSINKIILKRSDILTDLAVNTGLKSIVINELIDLAKKYNIQKLILFGSRARGTFYEKSDIDIAISGGDKTSFSFDVNENVSTLLEFDIIDLDKNIQKKLRASIEKDGIVIYEKL